MPGVQILFHSSGERVGGPNLPQRGFFVPAVRGAAVRCGDFSAGKGRSGRCRLRAEKEGRSGALRWEQRRESGGTCRCAGVRRGKQQTGGKRMEDGRWKRRLEAKKSGGRMSLSGFFYDKESADKPGRPGRSAAVLPPFCRRPGRRTAVLAASALGRPAASASAAFLPPPAICSGAR